MRCWTFDQSDRISHIDMGDDRIDTVISHIISIISHIAMGDDQIDMVDNHIHIPYPKLYPIFRIDTPIDISLMSDLPCRSPISISRSYLVTLLLTSWWTLLKCELYAQELYALQRKWSAYYRTCTLRDATRASCGVYLLMYCFAADTASRRAAACLPSQSPSPSMADSPRRPYRRYCFLAHFPP